MVEKHVCICSPPSGVSSGDVSPKYCRCNTTPESDEKRKMNTEAPAISKSQQKKIDAIEYNATRSMRLNKTLIRPTGIKLLSEHPYYAARIVEMQEAQVKMEADVRKYIVKGEEGSEAQAEIEAVINKTIALGKKKIENLYKKHYGRSKYIPH